MALAPALAALAAPSANGLALREVGEFAQPVYVTGPPRNTRDLYVVERSGRVMLVRDGRKRARPFLDIRRRVLVRSSNLGADQRGLLSIAFAPDFAASHRLYAFYVGHDDRVRVDEFKRGKRKRVMLHGPGAGPFDHGGQLQFGPDGLLYVSIGQTRNAAESQEPGSLRGKIVRIDPKTRRRTRFALGLRNPFRFAFDSLTGDLAIGDNGDHTLDEVDFLPSGTEPGANFGWPLLEGTRQLSGSGKPSGYVGPVLVRRHQGGWCSMIGGYVVRTRSLGGLYGRYLYGDTCTGQIRSAVLATPRASGDRRESIRVPGLASFGVDGKRRLYAVSVTSGRVYRIVR